MALIGVGWVIKLQLGLLGLLCATIGFFFIGAFVNSKPEVGFTGMGDPQFSANLWPEYTDGYSFFTVFAIFFPAVTGIMAGANISDMLEDPSEAIPKGMYVVPFYRVIRISSLQGC